MGRLMKLIKKNKRLHRFLVYWVSRIRFSREYKADAKLAAKQAMPSASLLSFNRFRVLMLVHYLEKGMCYPNPRPFGHKHITALLGLLSANKKKDADSFEYQMGLSILEKWQSFFREHQWLDEPLLQKVDAFLKTQEPSRLITGGLPLQLPRPEEAGWTREAGDWLLQRHSVRDFKEERIREEDLAYALKSFAAAPSACNRQMSMVYQVSDPIKKELLDRSIDGIGGLNKKTLHYFVITFNVAAQSNARERNQGFFNAGLAAMNFANALHVSGIGTCFVQWDKREKDDAGIRKALGLPDGERIAVVLCAGYYLKEYVIPRSTRRTPQEIYKEIKANSPK